MKERLETGDLRLASDDRRASPRVAPADAGASLRPQASSLEPAASGLLVVSDVRKSFRDPSGGVLEVLRGVSFSLGAGEMVAVLGASGAGKSTLLHLLGGLEAADGGSARLGDFDILRARGAELARFRGREIGFVFQFQHLLADLSAAENVALPLLVAREGRREAMRAAAEMLDAVGLSGRAEHRAGELSGGEQQRVAIARALVTRPRLVLADEPTGNLDARTGEEVGALLFALSRASRACVLVATHNETLARACDRRLVLEDGLLRASGA
ncbi:MAG: ABC transporter ATP-binding protein [Acidobacteria bacterium]|nr:ABC transporter ATP-binding protein [Acidobacteriota bacterium]